MIKQQTILCLVFLAGSLLLVPVSGSACGFNWYPPSGYFECCDNSGYVVLTEKLADLSIPGEDHTVPLWMWFNSRTAVPSPYAGLWRIGVLDISLVQIGENQFRMSDPGGDETLLTYDRKQNVLDGSGWKGEFVGSRARLWASCGWSVEFNRGRISKITTPRRKTLTYTYAGNRVTSISCDGKPLITVGSQKDNTLALTINDKKLDITLVDQPIVRWIKGKALSGGTEKSLLEIRGEDGKLIGRSYTYSVNEKMQPTVSTAGRYERDAFTLMWNPQNHKIMQYNEWEYTKIRDRNNKWDTIEISRKNDKGAIESVYRNLMGGINITQKGNIKNSEHRFTSGPAAGKVRRIEHEVDGKVTHFQKYAYDEKGRPIRGQESADKLRFEYNDKAGTAAAWKNDNLLWRKFMDAKGRIVKIEYPDNKELRLDYRDDKSTHPMKAELVKGSKAIAVQLDSTGLVKQQSAIFKGIK